mgnify:CR=1 FL=1
MYNVKSMQASEFIAHDEILETLAYASANKNNASLIDSIIAKAKERKGLSHREAAVLLDCELDEKNQEIFALAEQIKKDFYGNGYDKSPYTAPSPYTSRSGIAFGVLSIVLPWAGWVTFIFTLLALIDSGYDGPFAVIALLSILVEPFVLSIVFGIKAINTFKKARTYGVKPVAALVLGIIGLAESGSIVMAILEMFITL